MTRISGSPYSMWRDIAITNQKNIADALMKLEQRLAHIRENLAAKQLADEFERAHQLRKKPGRKRGQKSGDRLIET
jgi:prephenate dehydrogenase